MGSLMSPADHNCEDAGDGAYGWSFLSKKTKDAFWTICRCHHKDTTFSSVTLRPSVLAQSGANAALTALLLVSDQENFTWFVLNKPL